MIDRLPIKIAEEIRLFPLYEIEFCRADNGCLINFRSISRQLLVFQHTHASNLSE